MVNHNIFTPFWMLNRCIDFFVICLTDIFVNTKMDEGPCQKVHSEILKEEFQRSNDIHMFDALIEREFNNRINEADRVIKVSSYYYLLA